MTLHSNGATTTHLEIPFVAYKERMLLYLMILDIQNKCSFQAQLCLRVRSEDEGFTDSFNVRAEWKAPPVRPNSTSFMSLTL